MEPTGIEDEHEQFSFESRNGELCGYNTTDEGSLPEGHSTTFIIQYIQISDHKFIRAHFFLIKQQPKSFLLSIYTCIHRQLSSNFNISNTFVCVIPRYLFAILLDSDFPITKLYLYLYFSICLYMQLTLPWGTKLYSFYSLRFFYKFL